jgi:hypothetical protein
MLIKQQKRRKDKVPGGLADDKCTEDFDEEQLRKGMRVEMEHTNNKELAREIAMDHLVEHPKYYDELEKMEKKLEKEAVAFDSSSLSTLTDRNHLNEKIRRFQTAAEKLAFLRKAIAQNPPEAQKILKEIIDSKLLSSYPEYQEMLKVAYYPTARDNYDKFSEICDTVLEKITAEVSEMESIRKDFTNNVFPKKVRERANRNG